MPDRLIIVIPAYNEADNVTELIAEWHQVVSQVGSASRLLVVDDGSLDNTYELLTRAVESGSYEQLVAVTKPNSGHGATLLYGYHWALDHGADYVFQTDSDRQTEPEEFWPFWRHRHQYDAIIGLRRGRQDGMSRVLVTKVLQMAVAVVFRQRIPDPNCPFRLVGQAGLSQAVAQIPADYNLANVLLSVRLAQLGRRVIYRPITFKPRQGGVNSINLARIWRIGVKAIGDFWRLRRL
ncbi:MAG: glycosyltransferase family 2 protein [Micrococcales bacterium]|nr:glycosyltransferase family 2 protein [Micrococcales bacterium]